MTLGHTVYYTRVCVCKKERRVEKDTDDDEGDDGGHCSWIDEISVSSIKERLGLPRPH